MNDKMAVLVVDDDESIREFVEFALTEEGYAVMSACDAQAGLDILRAVRPALILLDMRMPGMDGAAFVKAYRNMPGPHAPIVVTSAARFEWEPAPDLAVAGHLDKPFDLDDLLAVVERHAVALP